MNFSCIDFIKNLHHHKSIEQYGQMSSGWVRMLPVETILHIKQNMTMKTKNKHNN